MRTVGFYHSADLDGICSGAIIKKAIPDAEMIGYDYGQEFPWEKIDRETHVVMADVSLDIKDMRKLNMTAKSFTWIDHHKSAIADYSRSCEQLWKPFTNVALEVGKAACELCWEYFFPAEETPVAVHLLGRYDVWDKSDPRVDPFQYGARHHIQDGVDSWWWEQLLGTGEPGEYPGQMTESILRDGQLLYEYQQRENAKYAKARAFETEFHGLNVIACNKSLANSQLFDAVWDPEKHDAMLVFGLRKDLRWKCSLYTAHEHVDVSVVAKKLGGGGHKAAAGFISNSCPIDLPENKKVAA